MPYPYPPIPCLNIFARDRADRTLSVCRAASHFTKSSTVEYKSPAPIGTVMSRLSRARQSLRKFLDGEESPSLRRVK